MATQWYWREDDLTCGPVSFQELVGMVRDRRLDEDDLVRPHYSKEWQTTDTVVGLYYMAQRVPVPRVPPPEDAAPAPDGGAAPDDVVAGRTYRLDEVTHDRDPLGHMALGTGDGQPDGLADLLAGAPDLAGDGDLDAHVSAGGPRSMSPDFPPGDFGSGNGGWDSVIQAAVDHVDARADVAESVRAPRGLFGRLAALYGVVSHPAVTRQLFRFMIAIVCCVGFCFWVVDYSNYEMSRFPSREVVQQDLRFFPLIGTCNPADYWAMIGMSVVVLGIVAYLGAMEVEHRWLELD